MLIHLVADASFDIESKRASYAFWIEGPTDQTHRESGRLRGRIPDSTNAELAVLGKAICVAVEKFDLTRGDTIVARSDCTHAIKILGGDTRPRSDRSADRAVLAKVMSLLRQRGVSLLVEHTKGHANGSTIWRTLNTWCDLSAKAASAAHRADRLLNPPL